jgi:hypothetical protein
MFVVNIDQLLSSKNTGTAGTRNFGQFEERKTEKNCWGDFSGKFRKNHMSFLVRLSLLAGKGNYYLVNLLSSFRTG